jgi:hypothetical protein
MTLQVKMPVLFIAERYPTGEVQRTEHVADVWVVASAAWPGELYLRGEPDLVLGTPNGFVSRRV